MMSRLAYAAQFVCVIIEAESGQLWLMGDCQFGARCLQDMLKQTLRFPEHTSAPQRIDQWGALTVADTWAQMTADSAAPHMFECAATLRFTLLPTAEARAVTHFEDADAQVISALRHDGLIDQIGRPIQAFCEVRLRLPVPPAARDMPAGAYRTPMNNCLDWTLWVRVDAERHVEIAGARPALQNMLHNLIRCTEPFNVEHPVDGPRSLFCSPQKQNALRIRSFSFCLWDVPSPEMPCRNVSELMTLGRHALLTFRLAPDVELPPLYARHAIDIHTVSLNVTHVDGIRWLCGLLHRALRNGVGRAVSQAVRYRGGQRAILAEHCAHADLILLDRVRIELTEDAPYALVVQEEKTQTRTFHQKPNTVLRKPEWVARCHLSQTQAELMLRVLDAWSKPRSVRERVLANPDESLASIELSAHGGMPAMRLILRRVDDLAL